MANYMAEAKKRREAATKAEGNTSASATPTRSLLKEAQKRREGNFTYHPTVEANNDIKRADSRVEAVDNAFVNRGYASYMNKPDFEEVSSKTVTPSKIYADNYNFLGASDDERKVYSYLANTDKAAAHKYVVDMSETWGKRYDNFQKKMFEKVAEDHPVLMGLAEVVTQPIAAMQGIGNAISGVVSTITGGNYNPYGPGTQTNHLASNIREAMSNSIDNDALRFVHDTGTSMADSLLLASTMGHGSLAVMGLNAATETAKDLKNAGATSTQIALGSTASGLLEAAFEFLPMDKFLKIKDVTGVKTILANAAKQAGIEAPSELLTEASNILADYLIRGGASDFSRNVLEYQKAGYSESDAQKQAVTDAGKQSLLAGLGGALSGAAMGGFQSTVNYSQNKNTGKGFNSDVVVKNDAGEVTSHKGDVAKLQELYQNAIGGSESYATAQNPSDVEVGAMYNSVARKAMENIDTKGQKNKGIQQYSELMGLTSESPIKYTDFDKQMQEKAKSSGDDTDEGLINAYADTFSNEKVKEAYKAFAQTYDAKAAYDSVKLAYEAGLNDFNAEEALLNKGPLTTRNAATIYEMGLLERSKKIEATQQIKDDIIKKYSVTDAKTNRIHTEGFTINGKKVSGLDFKEGHYTDAQKRGLFMGQVFSRMTGVPTYLYDSKGDFSLPNGKYNGAMYIDVNAGRTKDNPIKTALKSTISHEATHYLKSIEPVAFEKYAHDVIEAIAKESGLSTYEVIDLKKRSMEASPLYKGKQVTTELAREEIVAEASEKMLENSSYFEEYTKSLTEHQKKGLLDRIKAAIKKFRNFIEDLRSDPESRHKYSEVIESMEEGLDTLQAQFDAMLKSASEKTRNLSEEAYEELYRAGVATDEESGTAVFSTRTTISNMFGTLGYTTEEEAINDLSEKIAKSVGVSQQKAKRWLKAENCLSAIILGSLENEQYLDYDPDNRYEAIKKNSDYPQGTFDLSNLCRKREIFTQMFSNLQKQNPNTLFTADDIATIRQVLVESKYEAACALCYVEDRRQLMGEIAEGFIESYKKALESKDKTIYKKNSSGKNVKLKVYKWQTKKYGIAGENHFATDDYIPTQYDLVTYEGLKELSINHPSVAYAFESYNNSRGMQSARLIEGHAEYKREVLKFSQKQVDRINSYGGLRIFSFSDFEAIHLIDLVQVITDCSVKGIKIQAYTKVPAFAKLASKTGIKINRSLIPLGNGLAADGSLLFDTVEGIDYTSKDFTDVSEDNPDVGNVLVGINDPQILAAMKSDFIDYIIPFHTGQAISVLKRKGINEWNNYKDEQTEKPLPGHTGKKKSINIYKDVLYNDKYNITNAKEFEDVFLKECAKHKLQPRFDRFKGEEGYYKLLIDYKLFDKDGNILPQEVVRPDFNLEEGGLKFMNEILMKDKQRSIDMKFDDEVMEKVQKRLSEERGLDIQYDSDGVYSDRDADNAQKMVDEAAMKAGAKTFHFAKKGPKPIHYYHGTSEKFNSFEYEKAKNGNYGYGFYLSPVKEFAEGYGKNLVDAFVMTDKLAKGNTHNITEDQVLEILDKYNIPEDRRGGWLWLDEGSLAEWLEGTKDNTIMLDIEKEIIRDTDAKVEDILKDFQQVFGYDGMVFNRETVLFDNKLIKSAEEVTYDDDDNVIPLSERFNLESDDIRYSDRNLEDENKLLKADNTLLTRRVKLAEARANRIKEYNERKKYLDQINARYKELYKWVTAPDKEHHVMSSMQKPVLELLNAIDLSSKQLARGGAMTNKDISLVDSVRKIARLLNKIQNDENDQSNKYSIPPEFANHLDSISDQLEALSQSVGDNGMVLANMNSEQLKTLYQSLSIMRSLVVNANKTFANKRYKHISDASDSTIAELQSYKQHSNWVDSNLGQQALWANTLPIYAFDRFGKAGKSMFKSLMDGWGKYAFLAREAEETMAKICDPKTVSAWGKEIHDFNGAKVTTAQLMTLWCEIKQEDALNHVENGGLTFAEYKDKTRVQAQDVGKVDRDTLLNYLKATLTPEQIKVADAIQNHFNTVCQKQGNEITQTLYGFDGYTNENYFPITVNTMYLGKPDAPQAVEGKKIFSLLNQGFTKARKPNAKTRLVVDNIFDIYASHTADMAKYNAMALPILDTYKWYTYIQKNGSEDTKVPLSKVVQDALGKGANDYIWQFLEDLNGTTKDSREKKAIGSMMKNAKVASVAWNLRVALLQPTAYLRARAVLDPQYLAGGLFSAGGAKKGIEKNGIFAWKSLGYYDMDINRTLTSIIKGEKTKLEKFNELGLKGAEIGDTLTWGKLYSACEKQVAAKNKKNNVTMTDEQYTEAVNDLFNEVIYRTQVVDSPMTRSENMRGKSQFMQMLTAFKSEPTVTFNMLLNSVDKFMTEARNKNKKIALEKYGKGILKTAYVFAFQSLGQALVEGLIDAVRDKDDDEFVDKYVEQFWENLKSDINPLNKTPKMNELFSLFEGYSSSRIDMQGFEQILKAAKRLDEIVRDGKEINVYRDLSTILKAISYSIGVGGYNMVRDVISIIDTVFGTDIRNK